VAAQDFAPCGDVVGSIDTEPVLSWLTSAAPGELWFVPAPYTPDENFQITRATVAGDVTVPVETILVDDLYRWLRVPTVEAGDWALETLSGEEVNVVRVFRDAAPEPDWQAPLPPLVVRVSERVVSHTAGCAGVQQVERYRLPVIEIDDRDERRTAFDIWNLPAGDRVPVDGSGRAGAMQMSPRFATLELVSAIPGDRVFHIRAVDLATGLYSETVEVPVRIGLPEVSAPQLFLGSAGCRCVGAGPSSVQGLALLPLLLLFLRRRGSRPAGKRAA
jgi:hypothetical protein